MFVVVDFAAGGKCTSTSSICNNKWQAINPYAAHIAYIKKGVTVENKEQKQKQFCLCRGYFLTNEM